MEELRIDMRKPEEANPAEGIRCAQLCFRINHTMPYTEEYDKLINELFLGNIGENSRIMPPVNVVRGNKVKIGRNVVIMNNSLFMAATITSSSIVIPPAAMPSLFPTITIYTTIRY